MSQDIHDAVIIGAGFSGLGQGASFRRAGIDNFVILESQNRLGGVWRDNVYPGAACDTQSVIYCFSYFLHLDVSRMYADHAELLGYLEALAKEFDLNRHIRFSHEVVSASWQRDHWLVECSNGAQFRGRALIPGWGQLGVPMTPAIDGLESFTGETFHSARWRHDIDLTGKKVASIGAAASAIQYVPEIAPNVDHLAVFQRSANYILPRNQKVFTEAELAEFAAKPEIYQQLRQSIHDEREAGFERTRLDTNAAADGVAQARDHLHAQIQDPVLREQLTPDYEFGCKRILRSDDYYPTFNRDNVSLKTSSIARITPNGIETVDGVEHEFDVIIFGTGFASQAFQGDINIVGRDNVSLEDRWGNSPEAFLGITVDQFPNMFLIYGPNTNLNHHSIVAMIEAQNEYIVEAVQHLSNAAQPVMEVDESVLKDFNDKVQSDLEQSAYASDCSSWYKNSEGRVINNWSGTVQEYHDLTAQLNLNHYRIPVTAGAEA